MAQKGTRVHAWQKKFNFNDLDALGKDIVQVYVGMMYPLLSKMPSNGYKRNSVRKN